MDDWGIMASIIRLYADAISHSLALHVALLLFASCAVTACNSDVFTEPFRLSQSEVLLGGDMDTVVVEITPITWYFTSIRPSCDGIDHFEGKISSDNYFEPVSTDLTFFDPIDFSQVYCRNMRYGFMIEKLDRGRIAIESYRNNTGTTFSYVISVTNQFEERTIHVTQEAYHE